MGMHIINFNFKSSLFLVLAILSGCVSSVPPVDEQSVTLDIVSSATTNPNTEDQPTPISVGIYQLTATDNFQNSDFFTLAADKDSDLKNDIAKKQEFILKPGEKKTVKLVFAPGVVALGVVGAYREIDRADWMQIYMRKKEEVRPWYKWTSSAKEKTINVRFEKLAVTMKEVVNP